MAPVSRLFSHTRTISTALRHPFQFHVAADWAGKPADWNRGPKTPKLRTFFRPDNPIAVWREKTLERTALHKPLRSAGEDFFFYAPLKDDSGIALGIADGVGGWIDSGVDSSMFSQALMFYAEKNAHQGDPEECLQLGYNALRADESVTLGSSTACVLTLDAVSGSLKSVNYGDSGFCVIRSGSMIYSAPPQQYSFNFPKQLEKARGRPVSPIASVVDRHTLQLEDDDLIILYTDGMSDNLFPADILEICNHFRKRAASREAQAQTIAQELIRYAHAAMHSRRRSPFEVEAFRHGHGRSFQGGKVDDVTTVVAVVESIS